MSKRDQKVMKKALFSCNRKSNFDFAQFLSLELIGLEQKTLRLKR